MIGFFGVLFFFLGVIIYIITSLDRTINEIDDNQFIFVVGVIVIKSFLFFGWVKGLYRLYEFYKEYKNKLDL